MRSSIFFHRPAKAWLIWTTISAEYMAYIWLTNRQVCWIWRQNDWWGKAMVKPISNLTALHYISFWVYLCTSSIRGLRNWHTKHSQDQLWWWRDLKFESVQKTWNIASLNAEEYWPARWGLIPRHRHEHHTHAQWYTIEKKDTHFHTPIKSGPFLTVKSQGRAFQKEIVCWETGGVFQSF